MLRFLAAILRRLKAIAAGCGMFIVEVFDAAWDHAFGPEQQTDVDAMVEQGVAAALDGMAQRTEARVRVRREFAPKGPTDLPVPKRLPPSRSSIPDVVDPRREPERYACLQALRHTTRTMFGPGAAPVPDFSVLSDAQASRLLSLGTPALAAPVHREMLRRLGWESVDGWWWPHRQVVPQVKDLLRSAGGGPAFRSR